jgi:pilus assembly protein CpaF
MTDSSLVELVRARLAQDGSAVDATRVAAALRQEGRLVGDLDVLAIVDRLHREVAGSGPLTPLLAQPGVTDVLVNGHDRVYVDDGDGLRLTEVRFDDDAAVRRLAQRLAAMAGRRLDDAEPHVDVRLPDGARFHAVLSPPAFPGPCLSLRLPPRRVMTLAELADAHFLIPSGVRLVAEIVGSRLAFIVSGGTGCGKTTLLATLLSLVTVDERIVIVEDSAELRPRHPHVVSMEARPANVEGRGEITMRTLVRQALRMRPDRLVVGEVRGAEVVDLLAAMNTGHRGGCGTLHANAAQDVPARFEALGLAAGLGRAALHSQLAAAVSVVLHLVRAGDGVRRLAEVGICERVGDEVVVVPALMFDRRGRETEGPGGQRLRELLSAAKEDP